MNIVLKLFAISIFFFYSIFAYGMKQISRKDIENCEHGLFDLIEEADKREKKYSELEEECGFLKKKNKKLESDYLLLKKGYENLKKNFYIFNCTNLLLNQKISVEGKTVNQYFQNKKTFDKKLDKAKKEMGQIYEHHGILLKELSESRKNMKTVKKENRVWKTLGVLGTVWAVISFVLLGYMQSNC